MSNFTRIAGCAAAIAAACTGRAETGAWVFDITGDTNGSGAFEPGEVPHVRLSIDMSPDVGSLIDGEELLGFAALLTDIRGRASWFTGDVTWRVNPRLILLTGDHTVKDEFSQDLTGMLASQVTEIGGGFDMDQADPIWIADITWDPRGDYSPRRVEAGPVLRALSGEWPSDKLIGVWLDHQPFERMVTLPTEDSTFDFQIVPAPGSLCWPAFLSLLGARRKR